MPSPEIKEKFPNPQNEFNLKKGLLGPNLRLRDQLSPKQKQEFFEDPPIALVSYYPHSSLGPEGIIAVGEIYRDCYQAFGLERLTKITQVGEVTFLLPHEYPFAFGYLGQRLSRLSLGFNSTFRWTHSLTAAIVNELILRNNHFNESEIKMGIISALLHDAAITPLSDLVSGLNIHEFDEAQNLPLYLNGIEEKARKRFEQEYNPDYQKIFAAVKGEGIHGAMLKIADRLAYTAYDSVFFDIVLGNNRKTSLGQRTKNPLEELVDIFREHNNLFDIFQEVKFDPGMRCVYFENPQNLALVLRVRTLMYAHVYLNPEKLGFQAIVRRIVSGLINKGKLTKEELMKMSDIDLLTRVFHDLSFSRNDPYKEIGFVRRKNRGEVGERLKELGKSSQVLWAEKVSGFDTLTGWLVKDPRDGEVKPFSQICPQETAELDELNRQTQGVVAYYIKE